MNSAHQKEKRKQYKHYHVRHCNFRSRNSTRIYHIQAPYHYGRAGFNMITDKNNVMSNKLQSPGQRTV